MISAFEPLWPISSFAVANMLPQVRLHFNSPLLPPFFEAEWPPGPQQSQSPSTPTPTVLNHRHISHRSSPMGNLMAFEVAWTTQKGVQRMIWQKRCEILSKRRRHSFLPSWMSEVVRNTSGGYPRLPSLRTDTVDTRQRWVPRAHGRGCVDALRFNEKYNERREQQLRDTRRRCDILIIRNTQVPSPGVYI